MFLPGTESDYDNVSGSFMPKLLSSFTDPPRRNHPRRLRLEELEVRVLPAVLAGGDVSAFAELVSRNIPQTDPPQITADTGEKLKISLVVSYSPASVSQTDTLEKSVTAAQSDDILYTQIWIKNADGSPLAAVGGYLDLVYTDSVFEVGLFTPSDLYPNMATYSMTDVPGRVTMVGGMCDPGTTSLAVDSWALLGTVSFMVTGHGVGTILTATPTYGGSESELFNIARLDVGSLASSEIAFGSAEVTVAGGEEQLAAPAITTGKDVYVSCGANRHYIQWGAVANVSGYEVQYAVGGAAWTTVSADGTGVEIRGLSYGADVTYRVRALGDGISYTDSDWSRTRTFNVCPMDINNDGDISMSDYTLLGASWLSGEGEEEYRYYADIDGDGDVSMSDYTLLSLNWLLEAGDDDLTYPRAVRALATGDELFFSPFDEVIDLF